MTLMIGIGFQLINLAVLFLGIVVFILFAIVLFKRNKALDIWLKKNRDNNEY